MDYEWTAAFADNSIDSKQPRRICSPCLFLFPSSYVVHLQLIRRLLLNPHRVAGIVGQQSDGSILRKCYSLRKEI